MTKVYIVLTIESCETGENFILEKVFSNLIDAAVHKVNLEFKYNTELYPEKDKAELEKEYNSVLKHLNSYPLYMDDTFKDIFKKFTILLDKFSQNKIDKNAWDLPAFRVYIKEMTVDSDDNRERYDHC